MRAFDLIKNVVRNQLFAVLPPEYDEPFAAHLFSVNVRRFVTQCFVLVLMDTCSFFFYLFHYIETGVFLAPHLLVHVGKILLMAVGMVLLPRFGTRAYNPGSFLDANVDVLFPSLHFVLELLLFATGLQDLGACMRLLAVPFVMGSIPVLRQVRSFIMLFTTYVVLYIFLPLATPYRQFAQHNGLFVNTWIVVFFCAVLISFTVYSWFLNKFMSDERAKSAQTKLAALNDRLSLISMHDPLTGLLNRRGFQQHMDQTWKTHRESGHMATVIMIDIDFFKLLNDKFGHLAGDECLINVTHALSDVMRDEEYHLSRYGGEEFIAMAYNRPHADMVELANRLRTRILGLRIDNPDSDVAPFVTISVGVATRPVLAMPHYDALVNAADECLYFAKRFGRNQVVQYQGDSTGYRDVHGVRLDLVTDGTFDPGYMRRAFRDISVDCTFHYDTREAVITFSRAAMEIFKTPGRIASPTLEKVMEHVPVVHADRRVLLAALRKSMEDRDAFFTMDVHIPIRGNVDMLVSLRVNFLYSADGALQVVYGSMLNVEKILLYSNYVNMHALTSVITLLPNRQKLTLDLNALLGEPDTQGFIVFLDIRRFREINGVYGHVLGDKVLGEVALRLSRLSGGLAQAYHYDVDQFALLADRRSHDEAEALMQHIREQFILYPVVVDGISLSVEFSMVAVAYGPKSGLEALLVDLDIAIQVCKFDEAKPYIFFTYGEREEFLEKFNLNKALIAAVQKDFQGFMVMFQPIIDMKQKRYIGAEALLRWCDADGNITPPGVIIPMLEQSGYMPAVEVWIFEQACRTCRSWIDQGAPEDFFINVNLSPNFIGRSTLLEEIAGAVERHGLSMRNITFEVPETAAILEMKNTIATLEALRGKGFRIAIDDFGSGYSSLSYLNSLPVDEVKIDRSFVLNIDENESSKDFLGAVVSLAKSMNFLVCVEGIETSEQSGILDKTGADFLQGFYFGRPVLPDVFFSRFLAAGGRTAGEERGLLDGEAG